MDGAPQLLGMIGLSGLTGFSVAQYRKYKQKNTKPKKAYLVILIIGSLLAAIAVLTKSDWVDKDHPVESLIMGTILFSFFLFAGYYPGYLIGQNLEMTKNRRE